MLDIFLGLAGDSCLDDLDDDSCLDDLDEDSCLDDLDIDSRLAGLAGEMCLDDLPDLVDDEFGLGSFLDLLLPRDTLLGTDLALLSCLDFS